MKSIKHLVNSTLLVLLLILSPALAFKSKQGLGEGMDHLHKRKGSVEANGLQYTQTQLWFRGQLLDHSNPIENTTWSQRYWVSTDFFNPKNGSVFLLICGQYTCPGINPSRLYPVQLAQQFNALILVLEHRYYGTSNPLGQSSLHLNNMKYLTLDNALADLAYFIKWIKDSGAHGVTLVNPWITIGGSYPGAMSAWFRYQYPHLTVGAWASSAVVNAILDFQEYDQQVRQSTSKSGQECPAAIQSLNYYIQQQLKASTASNTQMKSLFSATQLTDQEFLFFIADSMASLVQYGQRTTLCKGLDNKSLQDQIKFLQTIATGADGYSAATVRIDVTPYTDGGRQWNYQCCTEFGWWQTAQNNQEASLRSQQVNINFYQNWCTNVFGGNFWPNVDTTNLMYGGTELDAFNLLMTNGSEDPWKQASILLNQRNIQAIEIDCNDCGHCVDLYTPEDDDPLSLQLARDQIKTTIAGWFAAHYNALGIEYPQFNNPNSQNNSQQFLEINTV